MFFGFTINNIKEYDTYTYELNYNKYTQCSRSDCIVKCDVIVKWSFSLTTLDYIDYYFSNSLIAKDNQILWKGLFVFFYSVSLVNYILQLLKYKERRYRDLKKVEVRKLTLHSQRLAEMYWLINSTCFPGFPPLT